MAKVGPGSQLGRFLLAEIIGDGATGTVFRATQVDTGRIVAIKLVHRHLSDKRGVLKRFAREARAASHLSHPNCIQIIDVDVTEDNVPYMVMEYIRGTDLAELLETTPRLSQARALHIIRQICDALAAAHDAGIVHRDIKPENIMLVERLDQPDFVKVLDFGIAKILKKSPVLRDSFETVAGKICGTPEYMSPEHVEEKELDGRSDLYSMGILLYELLAGQVPFEGKNPIAILQKHLKTAPTPPSQLRTGLNPALEDLILWLLAKNRNDRPADAKQVMDTLAQIEFRDAESQDNIAQRVRGVATAAFDTSTGTGRLIVLLSLLAVVVIIYLITQ